MQSHAETRSLRTLPGASASPRETAGADGIASDLVRRDQVPASTARLPLTLLVNPWARRAGRAGWQAPVLAALRERFAVELVHPDSGDDTERLARAAVASGTRAVVVAGGDGTINRAVQALAGTDVPLGIIPLGTANDLARRLALPLDPAAAASRIAALRETRSDVLSVNGRRFTTVGGLGIVSRSALLVNRWRARRGPLRLATAALGTVAYRLSGAVHVLFHDNPAVRVRVRGVDARDWSHVDHDCAALGMFVANQRSLGGGIALPAEAVPDDGIFELLLVHPSSRARLLDTLLRLVTGRTIAPSAISARGMRALRLECEAEDVFFGDGEALVAGRVFELTVEPRALALLH